MGTIAKIAPNRREGQEEWLQGGLTPEDLARSEEQLAVTLREIDECNRIIRQAREAEKRLIELHQELMTQMSNLQDYISYLYGEEGA
ncbi:hypothetical protein D2962_09615 [Biomaibacter acetigenes]|uniref:Uncharacterized protein n=1 Tax=Biomaibacter acetigenes TaxID=2316383 RepID=A0A3G2R7P6_9FIRM|nr:hypothetical protein [Biomaibacter acetigenes]AYO30837.1 hypothetical protein D2962_09615 [Biomaibacter acetigenes]